MADTWLIWEGKRIKITDNSDGTFSFAAGAGGGGGGDASAANQVTTNTEIGATNESSAAADNSVSGLNGLTKRLNARLTTLIGLFPASLGIKTAANSLPVVLPSDGVLPLPTGAATSAKQDTLAGLLPASVGQKLKTTSLAVSLSTNEPLLDTLGAPADAHATTDAGTFSLIALTKRLLEKLTTQLPAALGQGAMAASLPVTFASDQSRLPVSIYREMTVLTATIAAGANTSGELDLGGYVIAAFEIDANFDPGTGGGFTLTAATVSGGTFRQVRDDQNNVITVLCDNGTIVVDGGLLASLAGLRFIKIVTGANQAGTTTTIKVILKS